MTTDSSAPLAKTVDVVYIDKDPRKKTDVFNSVLSKLNKYLNNDSLDNKKKQETIEEFSFNQFKD
jgi:hypothetical protein